MKTDTYGADPALAKAEPVARLGPSGFDPGEREKVSAIKLESWADRADRMVTYALSPCNECLRVPEHFVKQSGLRAVLNFYGFELRDKERIPVLQGGKVIGTVPADFEPLAIKPSTFLYDVRPGDFMRGRGGWTAARNLGPGDFEAVRGFVWERPSPD